MTKPTYNPEDYIELYSGVPYFFMDPNSHDYEIEDIAHSLSMQCRYGGHTRVFYSVAEHCVRLADYTRDNINNNPRYVRTALLHDAGEAFLVDIPRPIKNLLPDYKKIEAPIEMAVATQWDLMYDPKQGGWPEWLRQLDMRICRDERKQLLSPDSKNVWGIDKMEPLGITRTLGWTQAQAKEAFLNRWDLYCW